MKSHTSDFKNQLTELGRELRGVITYNDVTLEEEINSITPHYEADILKSVMKQLDLELTVDIPLNTIINCQIGILINGDYEMLNYGNYVVYNSEKQEDTGTYKITCYDKLLYSMKQNEDLGVNYPISIKNYLIALGNKIGLSVASGTFYNQGLQIPSELYLGQEYTYRDILDEIAQATGSIICLNGNDEIVVKYPTITGDAIDEEYLKDINVDFGQKYGVINSIVLSRSGESDNVYLRDEESVAQNGLTEVKIVDNQIMNFNNRSDYLQGILNALNGLYYYLNDFNSTGILYYEVGDLYNVQIGENTYQCLMLNDEVNVTTGIEEIIHTTMPEKSETDYSKADKTDMRINKTYLIVDKQNQTIESVVNNVTEQNNKISQITQTVDEINSKISDIADITTYGESDRAEVELIEVNESEPIMIKVHPTSTNISYLYPRDNLYPSDTQYMPNRIIRFTRTYEEDGETLTENIDYELPDDLLRYSDTVYDEFYLNYESQTCQVIKRCEWFGGTGINLFNPRYFDGVKQNISNITISQDEKYTITPNNTSSQITLNNRFFISRGQSQVLYFTNLTNILSKNIMITIEYYNSNNVLINTFVVSNNSARIYIDEDVLYYTLSFTFSGRTIGEDFGFNIQLNDGSNAKSYETHYPSIKSTGTEVTTDYPYPTIALGEGNYTITLPGYNFGYLYVRLMAKNIYTTQFYTKVETNSIIDQKADEINLGVSQTLTNYSTTNQMNSAIILKANEITSTVSNTYETKNNAQTNYSQLQQTANNISSVVSTKVGEDEIISKINQSSEAVTIDANKINLNGAVTANQYFKINTDGSMEAVNGTFTGGKVELTDNGSPTGATALVVKSSNFKSNFSSKGMTVTPINSTILRAAMYASENDFNFYLNNGKGSIIYFEPQEVKFSGLDSFKVNCPITQGSLESLKKNIEKYTDNALDIIKDSEIYIYNFKTEKNTEKKHIGFVIGDLGGKYKTPKEVIAKDKSGIDTYDMTSILWKAVQEQQEQIEQMKKEIKELKGEK